MTIVISAKAGISGQEVTAGLHETPAFPGVMFIRWATETAHG
jgi:hypothetical protein